jgi:hypothetical protein
MGRGREGGREGEVLPVGGIDVGGEGALGGGADDILPLVYGLGGGCGDGLWYLVVVGVVVAEYQTKSKCDRIDADG